MDRETFLKGKRTDKKVELELEPGVSVTLTNLDKLYWPEEGVTKGDLLQYYLAVADFMMPYLQDRPAILKRYPNGIRPELTRTDRKDRSSDLRIRDGGFYQQNVEPESVPPFVKTVSLQSESGHPVNYAVYTNLATLLYFTNMGTIAHNPWHSRLDSLDNPDYIVFDLDPHEAPFENVLKLALAVKSTLESEAGLKSYIKTSGSSGLHLFVPLQKGRYSYQEGATFAERLAGLVVSRNPEIATLERRLEDRQSQQVYLDWLQNARGKAVAAAYTVRAKPGATVSVPLDWGEVTRGNFKLSDFTIQTAPARLKQKGDIWKPVLAEGQELPASLIR